MSQTIVVTDAEVSAYLRLRDQTRDFSYIKLEKPSADDVKIADADIEAYYKAHSGEFLTPEKVSLQYVELDAAKMAVDITPDETALKQRYEDQKARFTEEEQRQASHILVKVEKNANPEAQKAALEKAKAIAAEAKAGKDFAALAKENSDDLGSKVDGRRSRLAREGRHRSGVRERAVLDEEGRHLRSGAVPRGLPHHRPARRARGQHQAVSRT